jgi:hypothetical protein
MAQINVAQNGAGSATLAFEPGALAVDRRPPVAKNVPAAVMTASRAGGGEITADARLRELEYNDAMKQNAELKAKVEELGGEKAASGESKEGGDGSKTDGSSAAVRSRSSISCLASGDFRNPNFDIKGSEVNSRENMTCRSSAAVTEGRWYYEVQLLDSAASAKIGFAREGFAPRDTANGVGDDSSSWGFDGANLRKWHGGSTQARTHARMHTYMRTLPPATVIVWRVLCSCSAESSSNCSALLFLCLCLCLCLVHLFLAEAAAYGAGIMGNGKKWAVGDTVGCMLDMTSGTMSFTLNGKVRLCCTALLDQGPVA